MPSCWTRTAPRRWRGSSGCRVSWTSSPSPPSGPRWKAACGGCCGRAPPTGSLRRTRATPRGGGRSPPPSATPCARRSEMRAPLARDFERFARELPRDFPHHVRETYRIDLRARYLGESIPHPIGKGSGQLSLNQRQLEEDAAAGLAFAVLKTVIAQDGRGAQSMAAWAIHETRMQVERRRSSDDREGWTVTWKGRGWDRSFEEYLALVRAGRDLARGGALLCVPSVKYHLPRLDEPFREQEYGYTTRALTEAWGSGESPLLLEKDFSPTLAGDALAEDKAQILRWLRDVPQHIRAAAAPPLPPVLLSPADALFPPTPPLGVRPDHRVQPSACLAGAGVSSGRGAERGVTRARGAGPTGGGRWLASLSGPRAPQSSALISSGSPCR